ncbi:unnamed protein product [Ostreobium quekettii]|uniref:Hexosyltransferase n=1 Tax=Ostreobium quekettii TaxID=121088 RepID=A0A8S1IQ67_9CHLO|nr:unnamed protein product [Ostreobium quekettii]|eukprot:evm.model.scf_737.4 EVM.evm.TU.scf_737.4   scf_737:32825-37771(-)
MRVGRSASGADGSPALGQQDPPHQAAGRLRRIITWPWNLKKAECWSDALLERCESASGFAPLRRRVSLQDLDAALGDRGHPMVEAAQVRGAKQRACPRGGHLANASSSLCFALALAAVALLSLFGAPLAISKDTMGALASRTGSVSDLAYHSSVVHSRELRPPPATSRFRDRAHALLADTAPAHDWERQGAPVSRGDGHVEVMHAGWYVHLPVALNLSLWADAGVLYNDPKRPRGRYARERAPKREAEGLTDVQDRKEVYQEKPEFHVSTPTVPPKIADLGLQLDMGRALARCPTSDVRVLVAIVAACCGSPAFSKRDAIRKTWMKIINERYSDSLDVRFFIAQPGSPERFVEAYNALRAEVQLYNDIAVLPGEDSYLELPRKSLEMLQYGVESPCDYTHVLKIDDDCYLRADNLLKMIKEGRGKQSKVPFLKDNARMHKMYAGQLHGDWTGPRQGFRPDRNPHSKWYLTTDELPDELAPVGSKYPLGWGYIMSRDMVEHIAQRVADYTAHPERRPKWWALLPWEDTLVGVLLADAVTLDNHPGFKAAWNGCSNDTVVKHLDIDAPEFQYHLYSAELTGGWRDNSVHCSAGDFIPDDEDDWRAWRHSLPDVTWVGET